MAAPTGTGELPALPATPRPRRRGGLHIVRAVLVILAAGISVLLGQHAVTAWQGGTATSWLGSALTTVAEFTGESWADLALAGSALLIGLLLIGAALPQRRRDGRSFRAWPALSVRDQGIARLASTAALATDGVLTAATVATSRRLTVSVTATGPDGIEEAVRQAVDRRLAPLAGTSAITVHVREATGER
ncbi:DUF6286 domain-containing protein [Ruania halotolerans]|uniref:DUF6286 domain-containing protein n=1 Tax=Ruania halotolerans TaxID=2897773 RepID=UPI001E33742D|nr:DUF6286 domain-containing protein [Ruania halotolerans]UFU06672.1 DUF6286 domain-containing protein [Ruania halotolerans]